MLHPYLVLGNQVIMAQSVDINPVYRLDNPDDVKFAYWFIHQTGFFQMVGEWSAQFTVAHPRYNIELDAAHLKLYVTRNGMKVKGMLPQDVGVSFQILEEQVEDFFADIPSMRTFMNTKFEL